MSGNTETIGGRVYSFGVIPPVEAIHVECAVGAVIGESLFKFLVSGAAKASNEEQMAALGPAIGLIMSKMEPAKLVETIGTVFKYVGVDGKRECSLSADFHGRNKEVWQVFVAALRFNFADFMPADLSNSLPAKAAT